MRRLEWFIKVLLTVIGRLNFCRKFFDLYLPLNIFNPAGEKAHLPPFINLEPCFRFWPWNLVSASNLKNPTITKKNTIFLGFWVAPSAP